MRTTYVCLLAGLALLVSCKGPLCEAPKTDAGASELKAEDSTTQARRGLSPAAKGGMPAAEPSEEGVEEVEQVQRAENAGQVKQLLEVDEEPKTKGSRVTVKDKVFVLSDDGVWYDSEISEDLSKVEPIVIEWDSKEYEELLKKYPQVAEYRSVGEDVVLIFEGKVYKLR